jgi:hypothetical protein
MFWRADAFLGAYCIALALCDARSLEPTLPTLEHLELSGLILAR